MPLLWGRMSRCAAISSCKANRAMDNGIIRALCGGIFQIMYQTFPVDPGDLDGLIANIEAKRMDIREIALGRRLDPDKLIEAAMEFRALSQLAAELIVEATGPDDLHATS